MNLKYKETEIGLIPEEWELVSLEKLIDIKHGFAFKGKFFSEEEGQNILLTPGNFKIGGGFNDSKFKYYTGEIPEDYILKKDDIIITMTDLSKEGDTLGYPAKIPFSQDKQYLHNQRLGLLKFKSKEIKPEFLYWKLRNHDYRHLVLATASGTTVKHTSPSRILKINIALPSLNEQEKIAKILSDIDKKIELTKKMNQTLEEIGQAIFKQWFVHFEFPNEEGKPYKSSGGEMVDSELGKIPKDCKVVKLSDICSKVIDGTHDSPSPEEEGYFLVTGRHIVNRFIDFSKCYKISSEEHEKVLKRSKPEKGDTIFSNIGTLGTATFVDQDFEFSIKNVALFKPLKPIYSSFIYLYFISPDNVKQMENSSSGTTQRFFSLKFLRGWEIIMPSDEILSEFNDIISPLLSLRTSLYNQNVNLSKIRDSILPNLMSGKIRVK